MREIRVQLLQKSVHLLGTSSPRSNGAPPWTPLGDFRLPYPLILPPHSKPPSAAYGENNKNSANCFLAEIYQYTPFAKALSIL